MRRDTGGLDAFQRMHQAAFARLRTGQVVGAAAADVMLVFGDVGQMQEVGKGPDHGDHRLAWQLVEDLFQRCAGGGVQIAVEADRRLADVLDHIENSIAFLFSHGVAEQAAEQADVVAQRQVFFFLGVFHGAVLVGGVAAPKAKEAKVPFGSSASCWL